MIQAYQFVAQIMAITSNLQDVYDFHREINETFHNVEAKYYDNLHREMWLSLPVHFEALAKDLANAYTFPTDDLSLLDVGCGTGLSTELLLKTRLNKSINRITLLDTSAEMLTVTLARSAKWNKTVSLVEGDIDSVNNQTFDLILISSVLHHIPDLSSFLHKIVKKLNRGGVLITIHDPLAEAIKSDTYHERTIAYKRHINKKNAGLMRRGINFLKRSLSNQNPDYISEANQRLLQKGIIYRPLTEVEMWSITDIHVEGLPYSSSSGISINALKRDLSDLLFLNYRTYSFFGTLESNLPYSFRKQEKGLSKKGDKFGRNFGSIWLKKN